jgi:hypothetical protein
MKSKFDINRLFNFIRRQAVLNIKPLMIAAGAIFGTLLLISIFVGYFSTANISGLPGTYLTVLYICGFVFSSKVFAELHTPQKSYAYLTLPVSVTEKLIGSWLLSAPIFTVVFYLICIIFYFVACLAGNKAPEIHDIFNWKDLRSIGGFLVLQSVFFLGAVYFRNNNFMKTVFSLFLLMLGIALYSGFLGWLLWSGNKQFNLSISYTDLTIVSYKWISIAFWVFLAPYMLLVSYFRLKERQA